MSKNITLYTKDYCPYCQRALALLRSKNVQFNNIEIRNDARLRDEMIARSGRTTVPQIFIDDYHVGGSDDLFELEAAGKLDRLLGLTSSIAA